MWSFAYIIFLFLGPTVLTTLQSEQKDFYCFDNNPVLPGLRLQLTTVHCIKFYLYIMRNLTELASESSTH